MTISEVIGDLLKGSFSVVLSPELEWQREEEEVK